MKEITEICVAILVYVWTALECLLYFTLLHYSGWSFRGASYLKCVISLSVLFAGCIRFEPYKRLCYGVRVFILYFCSVLMSCARDIALIVTF